MSSSDNDERSQKKSSDSPEPSVVSMKSDQSMGLPIRFQQEKKESLIREKSSESPETSVASMKRQSVDFPFEQAETSKKKK
ncbi:hypothetical protein PDJAM_G00218400 [Pangasius djambal]|uniref:Uncharacterized protein n=1 Tax=Pangasius djambal TaxID=1691987 RepID=A0ACC5YBR1_9TELE|nr:hypothetical protein [Pangasius djambal]